MRLSAHCFAVTGLGYVPPWTVNAGFVCGSEATLIIDTGANALAAATIYGYAASQRRDNPLTVINTEKHFDHIGGNSYFRERGIDVYGHAAAQRTPAEFSAEIAEFAEGIRDEARRAQGEAGIFYHGTVLANANCPILEDRALDLGGCIARILLTAGHTPSNISIYVPEDSVLYCGDCLTNGYLPNLDCGTLPDWREWLLSLDRIARLDPQTIVAGHGPVATGDEVPRMIERIRRILEQAISTGVTPTSSRTASGVPAKMQNGHE
jgi:glyoxylase-like metal-dependent hydrolase (beta-lactamase superfamily II)